MQFLSYNQPALFLHVHCNFTLPKRSINLKKNKQKKEPFLEVYSSRYLVHNRPHKALLLIYLTQPIIVIGLNGSSSIKYTVSDDSRGCICHKCSLSYALYTDKLTCSLFWY